MGLLDSVKSGLSSVGNAVSNAVDKVETKVSDAVSSAESTVSDAASKTVDFAKSEFNQAKDFAKVTGQKVESAVSSAVDEAKSFRLINGQPPVHVSDGGKSDFSNPKKLEAAVRANTARNTQFTTDDIKKDPDAFLKNVVQLDGIDKTSDDYTACGPTAMMMGMIAGRPESVTELAKKLVDEHGNCTPAGRKLFGPDADAPLLKSAMTNIRNGKFSAADVTMMSEGLTAGMPNGANNGTGAEDLIALRSTITKLGVSVPRMEMQLYGSPDGGLGHWRVGVNDKQYNPWPNSKGQSSTISGPAGLADGAADGKGWTNREKLYMDDNTVNRNIYSVTTKNTPTSSGKSWAVTSDPPLFIAQYQRQPDGTFKRSSVDASRFAQVSGGGLSQADIDKLLKDVPPRNID
ncbi:MAG: hypothetical protein QM723_33745 [Myxococcaceae bacterium]